MEKTLKKKHNKKIIRKKRIKKTKWKTEKKNGIIKKNTEKKYKKHWNLAWDGSVYNYYSSSISWFLPIDKH